MKFFAASGCENSLSNILQQAARPENGRNKISSIHPPYSINIYFDKHLASTLILPSYFSFTFSGVILKEKRTLANIFLADPGGRAV